MNKNAETQRPWLQPQMDTDGHRWRRSAETPLRARWGLRDCMKHIGGGL
jgi:hypothetical protein